MPGANVTCPHCETPVEIQVTAVTRSRACPNCGQTIMLQVAGRMSKLKHKALLMAPTPPTDNLPKPEFSDPQSLYPGDAFERMRADPEVIRTRNQLLAAVIAVAAIIAIMAVMRWSLPDSGPAAGRESPAVASEASATQAVSAPAPSTSSALPGSTGLQPAPVPSRISFRPAGLEDPKASSPAEEAQAVLEKFLHASTVDEKLALVHDALQLEDAMRAYYQRNPIGGLSYSHVERLVRSTGDYAEFRVVMRDGTRRFAAVVTGNEGPRVDWPSFVALGDLEWEQMRQMRPVKPVLMRVLASASQHFAGQFSDFKSLRSVRLVPAANPSASPVYGYVPLDSGLGSQMGAWLGAGGGEPVPLTVKLSYPEGGISHDQAWIAEVVVPGWVMLAYHSPEKSSSQDRRAE